MTYIVRPNDDGTTTISVSFSDEGVDLNGETTVRGGETEAQRYLPVYEADLRHNFAHLFPRPEPESMPEGEMMP